jgi:hypothetical protein
MCFRQWFVPFSAPRRRRRAAHWPPLPSCTRARALRAPLLRCTREGAWPGACAQQCARLWPAPRSARACERAPADRAARASSHEESRRARVQAHRPLAFLSVRSCRRAVCCGASLLRLHSGRLVLLTAVGSLYQRIDAHARRVPAVRNLAQRRTWMRCGCCDAMRARFAVAPRAAGAAAVRRGVALTRDWLTPIAARLEAQGWVLVGRARASPARDVAGARQGCRKRLQVRRRCKAAISQCCVVRFALARVMWLAAAEKPCVRRLRC